MRDHLITISLSALAVCALAGCSSGTAHPPGSGSAATGQTSSGGSAARPTASSGPPVAHNVGSASVEVCSLLSSAQASSINSVSYGTAKQTTPASGYDVCTYPNTGRHSNPVDIQNLTVTVMSIPGCWASLLKSDGPRKSIPGLGDAAFGAQIEVGVKIGGRCLTVSGLTYAELQGHYSPDISMAKIILSHLS